MAEGERYSRVVYGSALTGGPVIVDESPGASARFWQAMIDSVQADIDRSDARRQESAE